VRGQQMSIVSCRLSIDSIEIKETGVSLGRRSL